MKRFDFKSVGINPGEKIQFSQDSKLIATVVSESLIEFEGEIMSTSGAALKILESKGKKRISVRGPAMWLYNGRLLSEIPHQ